MAFGETAELPLKRSAPAAPVTGIPTVSPVGEPELAQGLEKLAMMLEPDIPVNARWVKMRPVAQEIGLLIPQGDGADIRGNGFLVREKAAAEAEVWLPSVSGSITVHPPKAEERGAGGGWYGGGPSMMPDTAGKWEKADLAHDVAAVEAMVRKQIDRAKSAAASRGDMPDYEGDMPGYTNMNDPRAVLRVVRRSALLWSGALQRTGHSDDAAKIARLALEGTSVEDRRQLLDRIFQFQADTCWRNALATFGKNHDWKELRARLDATVQRFANGWPRRNAARVFLRKLDERVAQGDTPPLKLAGPMPEADQKILRDWLASPRALFQWTLLPQVMDDEGNAPLPDNETAKTFPSSKGVAAIPMLAALLKDDTLTPGEQGNPYYSSHSSSGEDPVDRLRQEYQQFQKLPTRGEIAWATLQQVLPPNMRSNDPGGPGEKMAEVLNWFGSIKNASPADIALFYLESGDSSPNMIANALKTADEKKITRVEDAVIATAQMYNLDALEPFVRKRGEKAAPFLKKLREKLEGELERFQGDGGSQKKQVDLAMKRLEAKAGGKVKLRSAEELLAVIEKGGVGLNMDGEGQEPENVAEAADAMKDLSPVLIKMPDLERFNLVMKHLPKMRVGQLVMQFYLFMFEPRYASRGMGFAIKLKPEQRKQAVTDTRDLWTKLLNTEFPDLAEEEQRDYFATSTAMAIECLATGKNFGDLGQSYQALMPLGNRLRQIVQKRAAAYLEGKDPEPLPEIKPMTPAEAEKLVNELGALPPADLRKSIDALLPSQFIAVTETLARLEKWPDGFAKFSGQVQQVKGIRGKEDEAWKSWQGRTVDFEAFAALARQVASREGADPVQVSLTFNSPMDGWVLTVRAVQRKKRSYFSGNIDNLKRNLADEPDHMLTKYGQRVCVGWFQSGQQQLNWGWFDAPKTAAPPGAKPAEPKKELPSALENFTSSEATSWEQMQNFFTDHAKKPPNQAAFHAFSASTKSVDEDFKSPPRAGF